MGKGFDKYMEKLAESESVGADFLNHVSEIHDIIGTAQHVVASKFGPDEARNPVSVLTVAQWILEGPDPDQGLEDLEDLDGDDDDDEGDDEFAEEYGEED